MNLITLLLFTQVSKVGIATSTFLTLDYDPVSASLGGAYVAVAGSPLAGLSNPAGIANLKSKYSFVAGNMSWLEIGEFPAVGFVYNMGNRGNFGIYMTGAYLGGMAETKVVDGAIITTGQELAYKAFLIDFTYAKYYTDKFASGVSVKLFREDYGGYTAANNIAIDVGSYYWTGFKSLRIALVIQNLGPDTRPGGTYNFYHIGQGGNIVVDTVKFSGYPLPMIFRMGVAMEVIERPDYRLTAVLEAIHPNDYYEGISVGFDLNVLNKIEFRTGYSFNQGEKTLGAGFGVKLGALGLNYAYTFMNTLPAKHRVQVYYRL